MQLSIQAFCDRHLDYRMDPGRRLYDQMVMAARCGVANIAEGSARHSTSIETELRLLDVARASIDELQGDLFNFLLRKEADVWAIGNVEREAIWHIQLDPPHYSNSYLHDAGCHILRQKKKFDRWLKSGNAVTEANALLLLCLRLNKMLQAQMQSQLEVFKQTGGFTENMTTERLHARQAQSTAAGAPSCPICGKPMLRRMQKKGSGQGREFWGCSAYPACKGLRPI
ncbi:MAG: four helix bundle suffix domain-containing protein [Candidatus Amulumruptor caecigallinarius]|nr:four helix bundle suffix domain-containing protein [Candidatus Amulumruptor caecigallinarius]MCM1396005.1 four helix bundle suffix domain-containing protein [Candidatus Amulumruptor caecigallinarius]MCM1454559.1 four helix bundle suffix domain-containing protein [bacterium]